MSSFKKVNVLEQCKHMFVCSDCCDPSSETTLFCTSSESSFLDHYELVHPSVTEVECVYCCCKVSSTHIAHHIQNHFLTDMENMIRCYQCHNSLRCSWRSIISHIKTRHPESTNPSCPICQGQFSSLTSLQMHLFTSRLTLYHCPSPQCLVKTHNKAVMLTHLNHKHNKSRCMNVRCQFLCAERLFLKKNPTCSCNTINSHETHSKANALVMDECQLIDLPYSTRVLTKLSFGLDDRLQDDLSLKMEQYTKFKVRMEVVDSQKQFICCTCQYRSVHSLADVRKHILGCHCNISTSYTRLCLRASRLDTNSFTLFSDRKLISFANEKLKRAENGSGLDGGCDFSGLQLLEDSEDECGSNIDSHLRSNKRQSLSSGQTTNVKKAKLKQRQSDAAKMWPDSPVPEVGLPLERNESFDRVIHLNYSWPVLDRLVQGQCPERYLPILKKKMDVYSQHRILLTRRNGKRYFLCSHCPNCSPHGMNDIRKHILGVHARLPERFKSAAMYCSRMNRDNYGLLSDEELLKKNQDMLRWRSSTEVHGPDDFVMEPLAPLDHSLYPEDCSTIQGDQESHNVFLSGDNVEVSPNSVPILPESVTEQLAAYYKRYSQMSFPNLFNSIVSKSNNDMSNESSPKIDGDSTVTSTMISLQGKGCSRRSLVLKSKAINHNTPTFVNNQS